MLEFGKISGKCPGGIPLAGHGSTFGFLGITAMDITGMARLPCRLNSTFLLPTSHEGRRSVSSGPIFASPRSDLFPYQLFAAA